MSRRWILPLLLLAFGLFYLLPMTSHGLWIPDETRYAQISQEMLLTGNWASPISWASAISKNRWPVTG